MDGGQEITLILTDLTGIFKPNPLRTLTFCILVEKKQKKKKLGTNYYLIQKDDRNTYF